MAAWHLGEDVIVGEVVETDGAVTQLATLAVVAVEGGNFQNWIVILIIITRDRRVLRGSQIVKRNLSMEYGSGRDHLGVGFDQHSWQAQVGVVASSQKGFLRKAVADLRVREDPHELRVDV